MRPFPTLAALLFLSACGGGGSDAPAPAPDSAPAGNLPAEAPAPTPAGQPPAKSAPRWDFKASAQGSTLALLPASGAAAIRLVCPPGGSTLLVNVPGFRPIGSEERLSFGSGAAVTALVADTRGDRQRGGVSGSAAVPADLAALIAGPVSASYGAQVSGPHPAPPPDLARAFLSACRAAPAPGPAPAGKGSSESPCTRQGSQRVAAAPLRAVGTEPFWAARIEGRCVTYSHPEDPDGTRVWTRHTAGAGGGGSWIGALGGRAFELRIRPAPGCSDGVSDRRYPFAAELRVNGESRRGCAHPL